MHKSFVTATLAAAVIFAGPALSAEFGSGQTFRLTLSGESEVPGPGDPDGFGRAVIEIKALQQLCYRLTVRNIAPATMAHVHAGPVNVAGPIVVNLQAPTGGGSEACTPVTRQLARDILGNPSNYYVNVHNAEFPAGAVRGQLD